MPYSLADISRSTFVIQEMNAWAFGYHKESLLAVFGINFSAYKFQEQGNLSETSSHQED